MFEHAFREFPMIQQINSRGVRYYLTPDGKQYPSVTTILGAMSNKHEVLEAWRNRIGREEAMTITKVASSRGNTIHKLLEKYVLGEFSPEGFQHINPINYMIFKQMQKELDKHLSTVFALETRLWSDELKAAGTVDLVGLWDGVLSIIDHKQARAFKEESYIQDYLLQSTIYALMWEERTGMPCRQIVVLIGGDEVIEAQVFKTARSDYEATARTIIAKYHIEH